MSELEKLLDVGKREVEHGLELHQKSIVCDSLCRDPEPWTDRMIQKANEMMDANRSLGEIRRTLGLGWGNAGLLQAELAENSDARKDYANAWEASGVTCIGLTLPVLDLENAYRTIAVESTKFSLFSEFLTKTTKGEHIREAKRKGMHANLFQFQRSIWVGGYHNLEQELNNIDIFHNLGVRVMQLTYNLQDLVGVGCTERHDSGLTHFGMRVVERMNRLGMLVDVFHCGEQTTLDAIEASKEPVAATHIICKALVDFPRGKTDEAIQAIAEKDGYIGITGLKTFTKPPPMVGTLRDWLDHIDHAVRLVGADHVGIASDIRHRSRYPSRLEELEKKARYTDGWWGGFRPEHEMERAPRYPKDDDIMAWANWPNITIGLVSRGYSDHEIRKIIGESYLKIIERVIG